MKCAQLINDIIGQYRNLIIYVQNITNHAYHRNFISFGEKYINYSVKHIVLAILAKAIIEHFTTLV